MKDFLTISGKSSEKLHCGNVVNMPYWYSCLMFLLPAWFGIVLGVEIYSENSFHSFVMIIFAMKL